MIPPLIKRRNACSFFVYYEDILKKYGTSAGSYTITINRAPINYPDSAWEGDYDGSYHSTPSAPSGSTKSGSDGGTNAGSYVATYTPDDNHCWSDGNTSSVDRTVEIYTIKVDTPYANSNGYYYNGGTFTADYYTPSGSYISSGSVSNSEIGTHYVYWSLNSSNYEWKDQSSDKLQSDGRMKDYWVIHGISEDSKVGQFINADYSSGYYKAQGVIFSDTQSGQDKYISTIESCYGCSSNQHTTIAVVNHAISSNRFTYFVLESVHNTNNYDTYDSSTGSLSQGYLGHSVNMGSAATYSQLQTAYNSYTKYFGTTRTYYSTTKNSSGEYRGKNFNGGAEKTTTDLYGELAILVASI